MKIVTAADACYFAALWQLLHSLRRRGAMPRHRIVTYDLGLTNPQRDRLQRRYAIDLRRFDFNQYPAHLQQLAHCGWKPLLIARELDGPTLWLDAATIVNTHLDTIERFIEAHGLYTLTGQAEIRDWCHPATLSAMAVPAEHLDRRVRIGGVIGFDGHRPAIRELVDTWRENALDARIIAPHGADRSNHRYDQSLFNNLLQRFTDNGMIDLAEAGDADISAINPIRDLTTRNQPPAWLPLALLTPYRWWRTLYKSLDRLYLRAARFHTVTLGGINRLSKEHFHLQLQGPGGTRTLPSPPGCYWADPFLIERQGRLWLFFEEFEWRTNKGQISALPIGGTAPPQSVLTTRWHLSFPFLFTHQERLFMLPESAAHGTLDLYLCAHFPNHWRIHRRLMHGIDIADTVLFKHAGHHWLMGSVRDPGESGRHLALFYATTFDTNAWTPHPINQRRLYQDMPNMGGRNAGAPFYTDGRLLRPVQNNPDYYGQYLEFRHIIELDTMRFREVPTPAPATVAERSHHFHTLGAYQVQDVRDRYTRFGLFR